MLSFLIKKSFFDLWDNLFSVLVFNLGFLLFLAVAILFPSLLFPITPVLVIIVLIVIIPLFFLYCGAVNLELKRLINYENPKLSRFLQNLKDSLKTSLTLGFLVFLPLPFLYFGVPLYLNLGNIFAFSAAILIIFLSFLWFLAGQYFFPIHCQLEKGIFKIIKKGILILIDNPGFSLALALFSLFLFFLSIPTALMFPGITGILIFYQGALKLRLLKYDYLEKNPGGR